jgi:tRNA modification GTPase
VDIGGWLVRLGDMAGLRNKKIGNEETFRPQTAIGLVEKEGMRRARARALESDVVVVVTSLEQAASPLDIRPHFESEVVNAVRECQQAGKAIVIALNKIDKVSSSAVQARSNFLNELAAKFPDIPKDHIFEISCRPAPDGSSQLYSNADSDRDPGNIQSFLNGLTRIFSTLTTPFAGPVLGGNQNSASSYWAHSLSVTHRQRTYLTRTLLHLDDYLLQTSSSGVTAHHIDGHDDLAGDVDIVAAAEHLRFAADCLAKITGKAESGDVEDVLGVVFEK